MASPPGAVPPPVDGEPDLPPGIAPPPEPGVSANASASDLGAANVAGWAGSADAHAAAWAAYQQQYAYQHAGGDWAAYHAAWANEWVRHNEAAAAAAAAPSAEQLAAVAAKIAEQITEAEKNETRPVAPASATADVTDRPACPSGVPPADDEEKQPNETDPGEADREASPPPAPPPASPPASPPPPPPEPAVRRGTADEKRMPSPRAAEASRDGPGVVNLDHPRNDLEAPALMLPRQIQPPSAARGPSGVEPRRARGAPWRDVAADALRGGEKGAVAAEKARLAREIETSRARLRAAEASVRDAGVVRARSRDLGGTARDARASRDGDEDRDDRDDEDDDAPRRVGFARDARARRRRDGRKKDVTYWERHYAAKYGIPLDGAFEGAISEAERDEREGFSKPFRDAASREGSSAATTATGLPEAEERKSAEVDDGARGAQTVVLSRETRRAFGRDEGPARETRRDATRGDWRDDGARERAFAAGRARRRPPLAAARASRAWGPNGTPPDSPERVEEAAPAAAVHPPASLPRDDVAARRASTRSAPRDPQIERELAATKKQRRAADADDAADGRSSAGVVLRGLTTREELMDPVEAEEIEKETALECEAFGEVEEVRVVRPNPLGPAFDPEDVGTVYLRFADAAAAERAQKSLHGRTFADRPVVAERVAT